MVEMPWRCRTYRLMKRQVQTRGKSINRRAAFSFDNAGDQIVKRFSLPNGVLATGAGTVIPVTTVPSGQVSTATEWASFAARYQQYRVRAIRVTGKATQPVQTATILHGAFYRGDFIGASVPATLAQVLSDENVKVSATDSSFRDVVTWNRNPNARLWNPTTAAIPAVNEFSWCCASASSPALTTATTYYAIVQEWEVEFRGSQ
jgi:hypothetical protein